MIIRGDARLIVRVWPKDSLRKNACAMQFDKAMGIVISYIRRFFSMNFHHVVQVVSPAVGTNDVRSGGEMRHQHFLLFRPYRRLHASVLEDDQESF